MIGLCGFISGVFTVEMLKIGALLLLLGFIIHLTQFSIIRYFCSPSGKLLDFSLQPQIKPRLKAGVMAVLLICSLFIVHLTLISPSVGTATPKWIDLSYSFVENETIYWPGVTRYTHTVKFYGDLPSGVFLSYYDYAAGEHGGTHMDAPIHFVRGAKTLSEVKLESVIGDAIVVNVSTKVDKNPLYQMTVKDLEDWEKDHGRIPDNSIVLMYTGRGKVWPNMEKYFGSSDPKNTSTHRFPGMHPDAAKWLVDNKRIKMFGLDTPSFDFGRTPDYKTHQILLGNNIPGVENVANLHLLPAKGAEVFAAPMKIKGGSGGPCRMFARIADKPTVNEGAALTYWRFALLLIMAGIYFLF